MYEVFEHTADLGLRVRADDIDTLFAEAARGLFSILVANLDEVRPVHTVNFHIEGGPPDELLLDWLGELLYTFETAHLLLARFRVRIGSDGLDAEAAGEPIDEGRHRLEHEIKAITYHGLKVEQTPTDWLAEVIVDI
jgi:SHS2 domain-containing protein